jgi:hypothetical protein
MRRIVAGIGPDGRSTVLSAGTPVFRSSAPDQRETGPVPALDPPPAVTDPRSLEAGTAARAKVWATSEIPPETDRSDPAPAMAKVEGAFPTGSSFFRLTMLGPNTTTPLECTKTVDYSVVVAGNVELVLEQETQHLVAGDCVILPGVVHGWSVGEEGCTLAIMQIGRG